MKQKTLYGIVILLICIVILVLGSNYNLRENISSLEKLVSVSKLEVTDINSQLTINESVIDKEYEALNSKIKTYEDLIMKWFEFDIYNIFQPQLIQKSYDVTAVVHTSEGSFDLPKNGYIEVDSDFVEIEFHVTEPPEMNNSEINQWLHYYDNIFTKIDYQFIENYTLEDQTLIIKYTDLDYGDQKSIPFSNLLGELLNLESEMIEINITDTFKKSSDYMPKKVKTKTFSGDLNRQHFTHTFDYLSDYEWIIDYREGGVGDTISRTVFNGAFKVKFENKGDIKANEVSWNGEMYGPVLPFERLILPEFIKLGDSWQDDTSEATITSIDYVVQTNLGAFETIEVTYRDVDGIADIVCYYAKNLGVIKTLNFPEGEQLIDVEYIK